MEREKPIPLEAYTDEMLLGCRDLALEHLYNTEKEINQLNAEAIRRGLITPELPPIEN